MAASFDAQGFRDFTGSGGTFTLPATDPKGVAVLVAQDASTSDFVTSVSFGGLPLAREGRSLTGAEAGAAYLYFRGTAVPASGTVNVTTSSGTFTAWGMSFSALGDTGLISVSTAIGGTVTANPTVTLPTSATADGIAFGVLFSGANAPASLIPMTGGTALAASGAGGRDFGSQTAAAEYAVRQGANIQVGWTVVSAAAAVVAALVADTSTEIDASVTGARGFATAAGHPGTVTIENAPVDATVTGERAFATASGHPGTVTADTQVEGARAAATADGHPGVVAITGGNVRAVRVYWLELVVPVLPGVSVTVTGARAFATAAGHPGSPQVAGSITVDGARAQAAAAGHPGTIRKDFGVTGARATAAAAGKAGSFLVAVQGARAAATAAGHPGNARFDIQITGARAFATADGHPGSVQAGGNRYVTGVRAQATATGHPGTVRKDVHVTGARAFATAAGHPGAVSFNVNLAGSRAFATTTGKTGSVRKDARLTGTRASASATGKLGTVRLDYKVTGARAFATASGHPGTVTTAVSQVDVTITGVRASATATGKVGVARFDTNLDGIRAFATSTGHPGTVRFDIQVTGERGFALAFGHPGRGGAGAGPPITTRTKVHLGAREDKHAHVAGSETFAPGERQLRIVATRNGRTKVRIR